MSALCSVAQVRKWLSRSVFVWFRNMRDVLLHVSIRGGRPKSEPPAVWMNFAQEPCPTWDVGKATQ
jgi:hypothetical protein